MRIFDMILFVLYFINYKLILKKKTRNYENYKIVSFVIAILN